MSQRKHPKYEYLTSRWGGMKLREEFEERIDNWLKAFDESEHKMLLSLLSQFYYYSEEKVKEKKAKIPFEVGNYQSDEEDDDINIYDDLEDDNDEDDEAVYRHG